VSRKTATRKDPITSFRSDGTKLLFHENSGFEENNSTMERDREAWGHVYYLCPDKNWSCSSSLSLVTAPHIEKHIWILHNHDVILIPTKSYHKENAIFPRVYVTPNFWILH
jgi:hypothetical protein